MEVKQLKMKALQSNSFIESPRRYGADGAVPMCQLNNGTALLSSDMMARWRRLIANRTRDCKQICSFLSRRSSECVHQFSEVIGVAVKIGDRNFEHGGKPGCKWEIHFVHAELIAVDSRACDERVKARYDAKLLLRQAGPKTGVFQPHPEYGICRR